jgi:hypothetical protein
MSVLKNKPTIVIETRGGTVVAMYGNKRVANVVLVDWDEFYDQGRPGILFGLDSLSKMPGDTRSLVKRGLADVQHPEGAASR